MQSQWQLLTRFLDEETEPHWSRGTCSKMHVSSWGTGQVQGSPGKASEYRTSSAQDGTQQRPPRADHSPGMLAEVSTTTVLEKLWVLDLVVSQNWVSLQLFITGGTTLPVGWLVAVEIERRAVVPNCVPSPFLLGLWDRVLWSCEGWAWTWDPPASISQSAGIIGMQHHIWLATILFMLWVDSHVCFFPHKADKCYEFYLLNNESFLCSAPTFVFVSSSSCLPRKLVVSVPGVSPGSGKSLWPVCACACLECWLIQQPLKGMVQWVNLKFSRLRLPVWRCAQCFSHTYIGPDRHHSPGFAHPVSFPAHTVVTILSHLSQEEKRKPRQVQ